jgi:glutamyl-tRNA reductase
MSILVVGINHHAAPLETREQVAVPTEERAELAATVVDDGSSVEAVVLSTCNRTEIVMHTETPDRARVMAASLLTGRAGSAADRVTPLLFYKLNLDAARHLFEVVTSLDSLVIGEPHIIGQIKEDFERAQGAGTVGKVLGRLFFRALELAKSVRNETALGAAPVSVSSIALDLAARVFGAVDGREVLVLGAGEMGRQTALLARHRGAALAVSSRTQSRADELAARVGGRTIAWEARERALARADIVITSTASKAPIIGREEMTRVMQARRNRQIFIIDIAVPRDVSPDVDGLYNLYRYDLDDLNDVARENATRRQTAIPKVEAMISAAVSQFDVWCKEQKVIPAIVAFRERVERIRKREVESHIRKMNALDERDRNLVEALSLAIVNKVLHIPTVRLKESATAGTEKPHERSLRYLFDLDRPDDTENGDDRD